jgi:hypothetical protein
MNQYLGVVLPALESAVDDLSHVEMVEAVVFNDVASP